MTVTTQQTGKIHKASQALGVIVVLASVVACTTRDPDAVTWSVFGFIVGGLLYVAGRFSAWWWHG